MNEHGIYQELVDAAKRFVWKVDNGLAKSVESYNQFMNALEQLEKQKERRK